MRILGIDPGFAITGYSIIDYQGNKFKLIDSGAVTTKTGTSFPLRLTKIYDDLEMLINEYKPDAISVEELFFNNNAKTAINVAQARGIVLVVGSKNNIPTFEYTPLFSLGEDTTSYRCISKQGIQVKQFEDRDILLENHKISIHDLNYYKNKNSPFACF